MSAQTLSHDGDEHVHPSWLAHHFDDAEQQFDAGKFGMWMFLVTEVLFFSGMFCAYSLLRSLHPEVFAFSSSFLNTKLGAINTLVLLFSSLTMAWGVRCAQLSQHRTLVGMLAATLSCAAIFIGVKSVEYSHKWGLGLLPGRYYMAQGEGIVNPNHEEISMFWLRVLCMPAAICGVAFLAWFMVALAKRDSFQKQVSGSLLLAAIFFFGGVFLGMNLESEKSHAASGHAAAAGEHHAATPADDASTPGGTQKASDHEHAAGQIEAGHASQTDAAASDSMSALVPSQAHPDQVAVSELEQLVPDAAVNQKGQAGLFFSIYYCMTGVHALHILGGMVVITWLIVKAARKEFHSKYFGPVDNVGLYWHLVDFIWIFLFPLLYLI